MAITQERMGFFNTRLEQRMNDTGVSARELATKAGVSYEHIRKLIMGHCLPSDTLLEQLCGTLGLGTREMNARVAKDRMIFRFGDAVWTAWGLNPKFAPFYILVPLLSPEQWNFVLTCITAIAEARKANSGVSRKGKGASNDC
jgi:transcriptional regulator with XRE-family HTH domain